MRKKQVFEKKENLSSEDRMLFREAMRSVKPLKLRKRRLNPQMPVLKQVLPRPEEEAFPEVPFSEHNYLEPVESETSLFFSRPGLSNTQIRALRRGSQAYQAILDLHGKTVDEARIALQEFLIKCHQKGETLVLIIHGKGQQSILKNKLNHWLRETETVLAFCSAKAQDGGKGALYLRLKAGQKKPPR